MINFELQKIVDEIDLLTKEKDFPRKMELFLIVVDENKNEIYKQECSDDTKITLINNLLPGMKSSTFKNREVVNYDESISKKNTHELVSVEKYPNIIEILEEFNDENKYLSSTKNLNEANFSFYMISLKDKNRTFKLFGSFTNILKLQKKFIFGNFKNSRLNLSDPDNLFGFNKKVDLLVVDDKFILINQAEIKFDNLFKMNIQFKNEAMIMLEKNNTLKKVFSEQTIECLKKKMKESKRMSTRLIKIISDEDRFNKTIDNISKIGTIINDKSHPFYKNVQDIEYIDGKLSAPLGKEVQLLNAISDAFYSAVFSGTTNVDESRM